MIVQHPSILISYSDNNTVSHERDYVIANKLGNYLHMNGVEAEVRAYSNSFLNTDTYQWLVFIHSPEIKNSPMAGLVNAALDQVVKRRLRGVIAVMASPSDLPNEWATIRKYDASDPREENAALAGVLRAMRYPKIPFAEAEALAQRQQMQRIATEGAARRQRRTSMRVLITIGLLMVAVVIGAIFHATPSLNSSSGNTGPTATAQAMQTALASTPQASPTVDTAALQQEYMNITKKKPTIVGFGANEQWDQSQDQTSCAFDASNPAAYHARIATSGQYMRCMATKTNFTNFALQVTMSIVGDAGGVIFRSKNGIYYRVAFNQNDPTTPGSDILSMYLCVKDCDTLKIDSGTQLWSDSVSANRDKPITFTIIGQGNTIDLYYNTRFVQRVNDTTHHAVFSGQIGVYAATLGNDTDVTFSNLKVWSL